VEKAKTADAMGLKELVRQMDNDGGMTWIVDEKGSTFYINTNDVKKVENCYNCRREK
jgi:predicted lipoprotein with Yx(FWY)xxD motif